jgi:hypothetical protein
VPAETFHSSTVQNLHYGSFFSHPIARYHRKFYGHFRVMLMLLLTTGAGHVDQPIRADKTEFQTAPLPDQWRILQVAIAERRDIVMNDLLHLDRAECPKCGGAMIFCPRTASAYHQLRRSSNRSRTDYSASAFTFRFGRSYHYDLDIQVTWCFAHNYTVSSGTKR